MFTINNLYGVKMYIFLYVTIFHLGLVKGLVAEVTHGRGAGEAAANYWIRVWLWAGAGWYWGHHGLIFLPCLGPGSTQICWYQV